MKIMKEKVLAIAMTWALSVNADAQVYADDSWMRMPTADLFDMGMMNAYARMAAEMAARSR